MAEERDVRFVTEESFDFGFLSPSDSQEEEEDEESPAGAGARGGSGRWSPLSGARLEEMVREATRLAAQLEQCHLPPPIASGPPSAHRSPRSPRRETFVVKDSPVRALLPTVEPRGPPPATARPPAKPQGAPAATNVPGTRKVSPSCHPTAVPKGHPAARVPPPSRVGPPRPCPPQGQGAGTRGKSEPLQAGTAGTGSVGGLGQPGHGQLLGQVTPVPWVTRATGHPHHGAPTPWGTHAMGNLCHGKLVPWGGRRGPKPHQRSSTLAPSGCQSQPQAVGWGGRGALAVPPRPPLSSGQPKVRGGAAPCPPTTRQPRARATAVPVPSGRPLVPSAIPRAPGRTPVGAPAPRGAGAARAAPRAAGSGCKPGPPPSRLRPPRKTAVSSTPR
ncbi:proline/serine-rich coiled-coil protein 1 isoform 2-T2 [Morphnus guianensis]